MFGLCMFACSEYLCSCGVRDDGVSLMVFLVYAAFLPLWLLLLLLLVLVLLLLLFLIAFHWKWNKIRNSIKIILKINVTTVQIKRGHSTFVVQCASLKFYIIRISFSLAFLFSLLLFASHFVIHSLIFLRLN